MSQNNFNELVYFSKADPLAEEGFVYDLHTREEWLDHIPGSLTMTVYTVDRGGFIEKTANPKKDQIRGTFVKGTYEEAYSHVDVVTTKKRKDFIPNDGTVDDINKVEIFVRNTKSNDYRDNMRGDVVLALKVLTLGINTRFALADQHYVANINLDNLPMIKAYFEGPLRALTEYGPLFTLAV
jgi:hypothetical protein